MQKRKILSCMKMHSLHLFHYRNVISDLEYFLNNESCRILKFLKSKFSMHSLNTFFFICCLVIFSGIFVICLLFVFFRCVFGYLCFVICVCVFFFVICGIVLSYVFVMAFVFTFNKFLAIRHLSWMSKHSILVFSKLR